MEAAQGSASRSRTAAPVVGHDRAAGGVAKLLANLPSRGFFSSTVLSHNPGGIRVYVCDHDTAPPEEQIIKTDATNILIRALQMNKQKNDSKDPSTKLTPELKKGKRSATRTLEGKTPTKRPNTADASSSTRQDGKTPVKRTNSTTASCSTRQEGSSTGFSEKTLQTMTVERLRVFLKERGLPTKGKKDELVARLRGYAWSEMEVTSQDVHRLQFCNDDGVM